MYYRGASAALLVYDLTSAPSFNKVKEWVNGMILMINILIYLELRLNVPEDISMAEILPWFLTS